MGLSGPLILLGSLGLPHMSYWTFGLTCHWLHSGTAEALAPALPELPAEVMIDEQRLGTKLALGTNHVMGIS